MQCHHTHLLATPPAGAALLHLCSGIITSQAGLSQRVSSTATATHLGNTLCLDQTPRNTVFSSEGEATDFTGDEGNVFSLAISRQPSPLDYIASSAEAVDDRWDTAVPTEGHTSLHPSRAAFAPSIATNFSGSPDHQSEVRAPGRPSRAADGGKTISSVPARRPRLSLRSFRPCRLAPPSRIGKDGNSSEFLTRNMRRR